jgi:hypothetical protein
MYAVDTGIFREYNSEYYNYCVKIRCRETSIVCAVVTEIIGVHNSVSVIITVLKSVTRKSLMKTKDLVAVMFLVCVSVGLYIWFWWIFVSGQ